MPPTWPHAGYDHQRRAEEVTERLSRLAPTSNSCPPPCSVRRGRETAPRRRADRRLPRLPDGQRNRQGHSITASGRPTLLATDLYGGTNEFLHSVDAAVRAKNTSVAAVSSSRLDDVVEAARCFELLEETRRNGREFRRRLQRGPAEEHEARRRRGQHAGSGPMPGRPPMSGKAPRLDDARSRQRPRACRARRSKPITARRCCPSPLASCRTPT